MNTMLLANNTLLLLTPTAEAAALWRKALTRYQTNFVIETYESDFLDSFVGSYALVIVEADSASSWRNTLDICHRIRVQIKIPILLLTERRAESQILKAYEVGVNECIDKPIGTDLLLAKANAWLRFSIDSS